MGFIKDTFLGGAEKKAAKAQEQSAKEAQQISRQYYDDARKSIMDLMGQSYGNIMNAYQGASQLIGQGKLSASDILRQSFQNSNQIIQSGNDAAINAILGGPSQMQLPQQAQGFGLSPQRMAQSQPGIAGMPSGLRALAPQNPQFNNTPQIAIENPNMVGGVASNIQGLNQPTMQPQVMPQAPTIQQPQTAGIGLGGAEQAIGQGVQNQLGALRQGYGGAEQALNQYGSQAIGAYNQGMGQAVGAANQGLNQGLGILNNTLGAAVGSIGQGVDALQAGEGRALNRLDQFTGQAVNTLNPFAQTGQQALNQEAALSGALGGQAQQQAINQFIESPAQKFLREQGEKAITRQAAATGGLRGGSTLAALQERGIGLAAQNQQQQLENLRSLAGRGQDAATNQAGFQQQAGTTGAGITANLAGQQASLYGQQAGLQGQLGGMGAQMANQGGQFNAGLLANQGQFAGNTLNQLGQQIGGLRAGAGENMANVFGNQAGALSGLRSQAGRDIANQMNQQTGALSGNQLNLGNLLANLDTGTAAQLAELLTGGATTGANANANMAQLLANLATGQGSQLANLQTQIGNAQAGGKVGQSGAIRDTAGTIAQLAAMFSDKRLKDNITKLVDGAVNIYAWTWKHISEIPENMRGVMAIGVIAQEVQQQYPDCVHDVGGYLAVDYSKLANEVSQ